jgi:hypothetical protein
VIASLTTGAKAAMGTKTTLMTLSVFVITFEVSAERERTGGSDVAESATAPELATAAEAGVEET